MTNLLATRCAICGTAGNATELYPANFSPEALNPTVFSARRLPDRIHYRLVTCNECQLVRSDPVAPHELLQNLYAESAFTYDELLTDLKITYGHYLQNLVALGGGTQSLLEIGCGNGFFLEKAQELGYIQVHGVEPSSHAVENAAPHLRSQIICDFMRPGLFAPESFDTICLFQVFDHLAQPGELLDLCLTLLKPGGRVLFFHHNVQSVSARLLKEKSPIVDVEHTYLYSPATLSRICGDHGFQVDRVRVAFNRYPIWYLVRLLPLPASWRLRMVRRLQRLPLGQLRLWVPLGNLYLVARKPVA